MTNVNAPADHDWLSSNYVDSWVEDWSARSERVGQLRGVAIALPIERSAQINVLDAGAGWGPLAQEILAYRPNASVTVADYSPPMLDHARQRLGRYADRVHYELRDFTNPRWTDDLGAPFDAVVSALAIHNLDNPEVIARVYRDIFEIVRPGGYFFNLEVIFSAGAALGTVARRLRAEERGDDPDAVVSSAPQRSNPDGKIAPRSLESQLVWLREAGFKEVDCLWKSGGLGLLAAHR